MVAETLHQAGVRVSAVNPVLICQFSDNTLRKVKTDKKDAMKIAHYAIENRADLRDYTMVDTIRDNLKTLVRQGPVAFQRKKYRRLSERQPLFVILDVVLNEKGSSTSTS